jgi:hypothetical protein
MIKKTLEEYIQKLTEINLKILNLQKDRETAPKEDLSEINCKINNALQTKIFYENWIEMLKPDMPMPQENEWEFLPKTYFGAPERRAQLKVIPPGPYCHVSQFDEDRFLVNYYDFNLKLEKDFSLKHGCATFAVGPDFKPLKVGFWYDTSD